MTAPLHSEQVKNGRKLGADYAVSPIQKNDKIV